MPPSYGTLRTASHCLLKSLNISVDSFFWNCKKIWGWGTTFILQSLTSALDWYTSILQTGRDSRALSRPMRITRKIFEKRLYQLEIFTGGHVGIDGCEETDDDENQLDVNDDVKGCIKGDDCPLINGSSTSNLGPAAEVRQDLSDNNHFRNQACLHNNHNGRPTATSVRA